MLFHRYRSIIPDWDRFQETILSRDPTTIRVRTGRISLADLDCRLQEQGFVTETIEGLTDFLRIIDGPHSVADTIENWLGLFYIQQVSSGLAAPILAVSSGEKILDMCAAPGGKTTHVADLMGDLGCIVAVDRNDDRIRALLGNLYRTVHPNVLVVSGDGRDLPEGALFDRVLVDVPCSAEGTIRRKRGNKRPQRKNFQEEITRRQESLLRKAIALTRPGGTVLYSTCTFAPEENEAVVNSVLQDSPVVLDPIEVCVPHTQGLTSFEGQHYDTSLEGACRIYPHHLDSGGLFLAKLSRLNGDVDNTRNIESSCPENASRELRGWSTVPLAFPDGRTDSQEAIRIIKEGKDRLKSSFGIDSDVLERFQWIVRGDNSWIHRCGSWPLEVWGESTRWRIISVGIRAMVPDYKDKPRPTNDLLRLLERALAHKVLSLSKKEWKRLLNDEEVDVVGVESGFVPLGIDGQVTGRGLVRGGRVRHEIPKVQARWLAKILRH